MEHLVRCFNLECSAAFTMPVWLRQDFVCPACKTSIGDMEDPMIYVECDICGRWKPSIDPPTEYCCGRLMRVTAED